MSQQIVLFGAGAAGGYALRHLRAKGVEPVTMVDNLPAKWGVSIKGSTCVDGIEGVRIMDPESAHEKFPDAEWVATAISRPAATEIRAQLKAMGVRTKPLWECLPVCHGLPPATVERWMPPLLAHEHSLAEWCDQLNFRERPDYDRQRPPSDIEDIYFPKFITHRDDEHFVDCGAADGDTVEAFRKRWVQWSFITAIEPDHRNWEKLRDSCADSPWIACELAAVSEYSCIRAFTPTGDYSAHLGVDAESNADISYVLCHGLDDMRLRIPPTYIKMDIEGAELEALWGARRILKEHKPVLAICAYHASDHLWQIPLLIHAIQPEYKLYLRRYAEGAFELVWYAVPPERVR